ncbi:hypothetical protein GQ600_5530 [Phytophthora cactorum]|nr:hypothetical protein GQ600_5530 [Phytophthora cactorum]
MTKRTPGTPRRTSHTQAPQPNRTPQPTVRRSRKPCHSAPITETVTDTMTPAHRSPNKSLCTQDYAALSLYSRNGTPVDFQIAAWLQADTSIHREILTLPLPAVKGKKKKTADVIWKILTVAMMENTEQNKTKNARTTTAKTNMDKKKTSAAKPTKSAKLVDPTNTTAVNAVKKVRMYKINKAQTLTSSCYKNRHTQSYC